jgi:hypothetical protein
MPRKHTRRTRRTHRTHRGGRSYTTAGAAELKQMAPAMYGGKSESSSKNSNSGESINMSPRNRNNLTMRNGMNMGRRVQVVHGMTKYHNNSKKNMKHPSLGMIGHLWSNSKNSTLRAAAKPFKPLRANAKPYTPY